MTKSKVEGESLALKIFTVMKEVGDSTTIPKIREALINNSLMILPSHEQCDTGKHFTKLNVRYTIIDLSSGESTELVSYGLSEGENPLREAVKMAEKNFFSMLLLTEISKEGNR